ncbi:MAG: transporter substrate-binding domain-containing protein [Candidatus Delongbacteria bacterium]|nr:transporter substrate-binding domain-containing protein [Candidatus Delongbacteria bacterium]
MKSITLTLLVSTFIVLGSKIIFSTQDFPPFSYLENDKVSGPATEVIEAVCKKAGFESEVLIYPWRRANMLVRTGDIDGLYLLGKTEDRDSWLYFSHPILKTEYGLFLNKENHFDYSSKEDLIGKNLKVGVYGPSNTSSKLDDLQDVVKDMTIEMTPDDLSGFRKLEIGRVDAVYSNKIVGDEIIKNEKLKNVQYAGKDCDVVYYFAISKKKISQADFNKLNNAYKSLYNEGIIDKILAKKGIKAYKLDE